MSKTPDLVLKHKWYDMTLAGIKLEEYRDETPYYAAKLLMTADGERTRQKDYSFECGQLCYGMMTVKEALRLGLLVPRFEYIREHRGYTSTTSTYASAGLEMRCGNPQWGAEPGKEYFVIKLAERI